MRILLVGTLLAGLTGCGDPVVECGEGEVEVDGSCLRLDAGVDVGTDAPIDVPTPDTSFDACEPVDEICNGVDEDCDGDVDEMVLLTFYVDADGDGQGDPDRSCEACSADECEPGLTWVELGEDCDDDCDVCSPDLTEICDELDNDCDESTDEEVTTTYYLDTDDDDFGDDAMTVEACAVPEGYVEVGGDCAVDDPDAFPGQTAYFGLPVEGVGGFDYDCNGNEDVEVAASAATCTGSGADCPASVRFMAPHPGCGNNGTTFTCLRFMGVCNGSSATGTATARCR